MRRSTLTLGLALAALSLLATSSTPARTSRADRESAEEARQESARLAREKASSQRMAEVLIQEEIIRRQRAEATARSAADNRVDAGRGYAAEPNGVKPGSGEPVTVARSANPNADSGLDAVFGRDERLEAPSGRHESYYPPVVVPATAAAEPAAEPAANIASTMAEPRLELFHTGYSRYSQGDYQAARESFSAFLAASPGHDLADSAQYWLGQCAAAQGDYKTALADYQLVVQSFPFGDKVPDALLKSGDALVQLGREPEARRVWQQLLSDFPASGAARRARERLGDDTVPGAAAAAAASGR